MEPATLSTSTAGPLDPPRLERSEALLIFGLSARHAGSNAAIPSQWDRFIPYLGHIEHQVRFDAFGVICNTDESGTMEYICGVHVSEYPSEPHEFARLRIPLQRSNATDRPSMDGRDSVDSRSGCP